MKSKETGHLRDDFKLTVKIKSPYFKPTAHLDIPIYYIPQLELESSVSSSNKTLFVSCYSDFSTAFLYSNDKEFTNDLLEEAKVNFIESGPPKKLTVSGKQLKEQLSDHTKSAEYLGEFKTVFVRKENPALTSVTNASSSVSGTRSVKMKDIVDFLVSAKQLM